MVEDLQLQALQLGSGVEAELLAERGAGRRQRAHGVGLAAGPVLGQGQLAPAALAQRLLGHRLLELPDDGAVAAEGQLDVEAVLHDGGPPLLEAHDDRLHRHLAGQPGEGRAPPEGEGFVEAVEGGGRRRPPRRRGDPRRPATRSGTRRWRRARPAGGSRAPPTPGPGPGCPAVRPGSRARRRREM